MIVDYTVESLNAPPMDFSYKNIKELTDLLKIEPRQVLQSVKVGNTYKMESKPALRKPIIQEQE